MHIRLYRESSFVDNQDIPPQLFLECLEVSAIPIEGQEMTFAGLPTIGERELWVVMKVRWHFKFSDKPMTKPSSFIDATVFIKKVS